MLARLRAKTTSATFMGTSMDPGASSKLRTASKLLTFRTFQYHAISDITRRPAAFVRDARGIFAFPCFNCRCEIKISIPHLNRSTKNKTFRSTVVNRRPDSRSDALRTARRCTRRPLSGLICTHCRLRDRQARASTKEFFPLRQGNRWAFC